MAGLLWAVAVVLSGLLAYALWAPHRFCAANQDLDELRPRWQVHAVYQWPPPVISCRVGVGPTSADAEVFVELWDWPALLLVAAVDVVALVVLVVRRRRFPRRRVRSRFPALE